MSQCRTTIGNTCFRGIQQEKSKLYLASVEDPVPIIEDIAGLDKVEITVDDNGDLSEPLNPEGGKYVFISFDDTAATDESKASKLSRHDEFVKKLTTQLKAQTVNFMVIYTGRRTEHQRRVARQAVTQASSTSATVSSTTSATTTTTASTKPKQDVTPTPKFWKRDRLLMYYLGLESVSAGVATDIEVGQVSLTELSATKIGVAMTSGTNTFAFNITGEAGYWWVHEFEWNNQAISSSHRIAAMEAFSFHCSPSIEIASLNPNVLIRWTGLQIEPVFGTLAETPIDKFSDSWDCVGFVSAGIVGGLFVVIMLLFILSIGISWMMDINTMDRFDDPKGKTITVSVNE